MRRATGEPLAIRGQVSISRYTSSNGPGGWCISINDRASCGTVVEVDLTDQDFARCLGGHSHVEGEGKVYRDAADRWGLVMETTTIRIEVPEGKRHAKWDPEAATMHAQAAADIQLGNGWKVDAPGRWNMHRWADGLYSFHARRWVEVEE